MATGEGNIAGRHKFGDRAFEMGLFKAESPADPLIATPDSLEEHEAAIGGLGDIVKKIIHPGATD